MISSNGPQSMAQGGPLLDLPLHREAFVESELSIPQNFFDLAFQVV